MILTLGCNKHLQLAWVRDPRSAVEYLAHSATDFVDWLVQAYGRPDYELHRLDIRGEKFEGAQVKLSRNLHNTSLIFNRYQVTGLIIPDEVPYESRQGFGLCKSGCGRAGLTETPDHLWLRIEPQAEIA